MKGVVLLLVIGSLALSAFDGEKTYKQCSMCHGNNAEKPAINFSAVLNSLSEEELSSKLNAILDGSTGMTSRLVGVHKAKLRGITKENVGLMSKYIISLKK